MVRASVFMCGLAAAAALTAACLAPEINPEADSAFKLDQDNNLVFTSYRSTDDTYPAFQPLIRPVKNLAEPEKFEVLTVIPYGKKAVMLITRQHGLLATDDLGENWRRLDSRLPREVVYPFASHGLTKPVVGLSVSRDKRRIALLFAESLLLSENGGKTFRTAALEGASSNVEFLCVAWHPDNKNLILIGTAQLGSKAHNGVYLSSDGGKSITGIDAGLPGEPTYHPNYFEEVRALCFGSDPDVFFAGLGNGGGVYRGSIRAGRLVKLDRPELYTYPDGDFYRVETLAYRNGSLYVTTNRRWRKIIPVDGHASGADNDRVLDDLFLGQDSLISVHTAAGDNISFAGAYTPRRSQAPDPRAAGKKGLYISYTFTQGDNYPKLLALLTKLKLNAVIINVKDDYGSIHVKTDDPLLAKVKDAVEPYVNFTETMTRLKKDGVYVIGRLVVFKDTLLYDYDKHKYAIKKRDGKPLTKGPEKWVDGYSEFVWDYNIAAARAIAAAGVDEIQFDYIRFPDLKGASVGNSRYDFQKPGQTQREALLSFLKKAKEQLSVPTSVDLFGFQAVYKFGRWIGQDITEMAAQVDVVSPMFYPSHYSGGYAEGYKDKQIYYTILLSCKRAQELLNGALLRPYIQAFYYKDNKDNYCVDYIGWELDGIKDSNTQDYIFWNDLSEYVILVKGMRQYLGDKKLPTSTGIKAELPKKMPYSSILEKP